MASGSKGERKKGIPRTLPNRSSCQQGLLRLSDWARVKMSDMTPETSKNVGTYEGNICKRGGCDGEIEIKATENCSCHISPPCSGCEEAPLYCPKCLWEEDK